MLADPGPTWEKELCEGASWLCARKACRISYTHRINHLSALSTVSVQRKNVDESRRASKASLTFPQEKSVSSVGRDVSHLELNLD